MRWPLGILIAISMFTAIVSGCGKSSAPVITAPTVAQIAEFTKKAAVILPATAKPTSWMEQRGMDDALWLRIEMPITALDAFLKASPFRDGEFQTNLQSDLYNFKDLISSPLLKYRSGQKALPNAKTLNMLIDDSNPTNSVVFMMWFEM